MRFSGHSPLGQPSQRHDGTLVATYTYDQQNRVTQVIEEPGQNQPTVTRDLAYDSHGNLTSETTSGGGAEQRIYINTFDPADRLTQATLNGRVIQALAYLPGTDLGKPTNDRSKPTVLSCYHMSSRAPLKQWDCLMLIDKIIGQLKATAVSDSQDRFFDVLLRIGTAQHAGYTD